MIPLTILCGLDFQPFRSALPLLGQLLWSAAVSLEPCYVPALHNKAASMLQSSTLVPVHEVSSEIGAPGSSSTLHPGRGGSAEVLGHPIGQHTVGKTVFELPLDAIVSIHMDFNPNQGQCSTC